MEQCRLCKCTDKPLKESHIIPKMFYNELKRNSPTHIMRMANNPNRGVQDGLKLPFLCGECEELFSKYERAFSNRIYQKAIANDGEIKFESKDDALSYFLLSVAWRVIKHIRETDKTTLTECELEKMGGIIETWRRILYDENMEEIRKVQQFIIPTKNLRFFEKIPFRVHDNVMIDFKLGKVIKSYRSTLPKNITKCLEDLHFTKYFEANDKLTEKQRKLIEERV